MGWLAFFSRADSMETMSIELTIAKLQEANHSFVPSECTYEVAVVADHLSDLSMAEQKLIESWAVHRQHEFATGRMCARRALAALKIPSADLLPDADGVPVWPSGMVGSISHSRGVAMAVAAHSEDCVLLGLDLEKTNRLSEAAMGKVVHPLEEPFAGGGQLQASILFSLKEAFYKAQFPRWRTPGNFYDLALAVDMEAGTARALALDSRFAPELTKLSFAYRLMDDYVVSLCWGRA